MIRWTGCVVVALVTGLGAPTFAQMGGMGGGFGGGYRMFGNAGADDPKTALNWPVTVQATDGNSTRGQLRLTTAVIDCKLGIYEIRPEKIQEIRFKPVSSGNAVLMDQSGMQRAGTLVTTTGEEIEGVILILNWWRIETDLGVLTPRSDGIKVITFGKRAEVKPAPAEAPPPQQLEAIPPPRTTS